MSNDYTRDCNIDVLVIADEYGDTARIGFGDDGIGIRTFTDEYDQPGPIVRVQGEDLWTLRELLNAMPEEAFVEPAPVDGDRWLPGDVVTFETRHGGTKFALVRQPSGGVWARYRDGEPTGEPSDWSDADVTRLVRREGLNLYVNVTVAVKN